METAGSAARPALTGGPSGMGCDFDTFARRERRALVAFGWTLTGDMGVAEDLAQEALEAAWQRWSSVGSYDKPAAWARRVLANRAAGRGRRIGSERRAFGRWLGRPMVTVELEQADDLFWTEVRRLPRRQAEVIALHYLEELSVAEVAAVLGCAEGTVKSHLHRGRLALARSLGIGEGDPR